MNALVNLEEVAEPRVVCKPLQQGALLRREKKIENLSRIRGEIRLRDGLPRRPLRIVNGDRHLMADRGRSLVADDRGPRATVAGAGRAGTRRLGGG